MVTPSLFSIVKADRRVEGIEGFVTLLEDWAVPSIAVASFGADPINRTHIDIGPKRSTPKEPIVVCNYALAAARHEGTAICVRDHAVVGRDALAQVVPKRECAVHIYCADAPTGSADQVNSSTASDASLEGP